MTKKLSNIPLKDFRKFLKDQGCVLVRTSGGHELWQKEGASRTLVVQTHKDPVPIHVVKNCLEELGLTREDL